MNPLFQTHPADRPPRQHWPLLVAVATLAVSGITYRLAAARYARAPESAPLPPGTLGRLPITFGNWSGREIPVDQRIIRATDSDAHLSREYTHGTGGEKVRLWVAYGTRMRDLMPHRPEVCYPGAGWTLQDAQMLESKAPDGSIRSFKLYRFDRSGLDSRGVSVLHWYLVDGEHTPDVALLRSKAWRPPPKSSYVLQVQISGDATDSHEPIRDSVVGLANAVAIALEELLASLPK